jgi:hypothetical protein
MSQGTNSHHADIFRRFVPSPRISSIDAAATAIPV